MMRWLRPGLIVAGCLMLAACRAPKKKTVTLTPLNSGGGHGHGAMSERAERSSPHENQTQPNASASATEQPVSETGKVVEHSKETTTSDKPSSPVVATEKPTKALSPQHEDVVGAVTPSQGRKDLIKPIAAGTPLPQTIPKRSDEKTSDSHERAAAAKDTSEFSSTDRKPAASSQLEQFSVPTPAPHPYPARSGASPLPVSLGLGAEGKASTLRGSKLFDDSLAVPNGAGGERTPPAQNALQIGQRHEQTKATPFSPSDGEKVRMIGSGVGIGPAQSLHLQPNVSSPASARDGATLPLVAKDASHATAKSPASSIDLNPEDRTRPDVSSVATRHIGAGSGTSPRTRDTAATSAKLWDGVMESSRGSRGQLPSAPQPSNAAGEHTATSATNSSSSRRLPAVSTSQESGEEHPATPVAIEQWLHDRQAEACWRESQVAQQADEQKAKEEQWNKFRRSFYRFLLGTSGKESE